MFQRFGCKLFPDFPCSAGGDFRRIARVEIAPRGQKRHIAARGIPAEARLHKPAAKAADDVLHFAGRFIKPRANCFTKKLQHFLQRRSVTGQFHVLRHRADRVRAIPRLRKRMHDPLCRGNCLIVNNRSQAAIGCRRARRVFYALCIVSHGGKHRIVKRRDISIFYAHKHAQHVFVKLSCLRRFAENMQPVRHSGIL